MKIKLPFPIALDFMPVDLAIKQRKTKRVFLKKNLSLEQVSLLLWSAQGKRGEEEKLNAPSAGGINPLTVFVLLENVLEREHGIFRYNHKTHSLSQVKRGKFREKFGKMAIGEQPWIGQASIIIIITANMELMKHSFASQPPINKRGSRYVYIETGAVAQNIHLCATALGLGMVLVGGFDNDAVNSTLGLLSGYDSTALLCVGNVQGTPAD